MSGKGQKLLKRNCRRFEYFAYTGLTSDLNEDGLHTGVPKPVYDDPVEYEGNISAPSGQSAQTFAGLDIRYTHVLVMDDPDIGIAWPIPEDMELIISEKDRKQGRLKDLME